MLISIISQGLIWAILGLGIFMTFRILDFPRYDHRGFLSIRRSRCGNSDYQRGSPFISHPGGHWCGVHGWIGYRSSLYQRKDSDAVIGGFLVMTSCNSVILFVMQRANLGLLGYSKIQDMIPIASGVKRDYHRDHLCDPGDCRYALRF